MTIVPDNIRENNKISQIVIKLKSFLIVVTTFSLFLLEYFSIIKIFYSSFTNIIHIPYTITEDK